MAVSFFFGGGAPFLLGVYIRAPEFWKLPSTPGSRSWRLGGCGKWANHAGITGLGIRFNLGVVPDTRSTYEAN